MSRQKAWSNWFKRELREEDSENRDVYTEIVHARTKWEEAVMYFEEASGADEIDYAIYMLEAAELKYQMHLKKAKEIGLNRTQIYDAGESVV